MRSLVVALVACGGSPPPRPPEPPPIAAPLPCGAPIGDPDHDVRITAPENARLLCEQGRTKCVARFRATVRNCRSEALTAGGQPMYFDMDHPWVRAEADTQHRRLAPGESWTFLVAVNGEGETRVRVRIEATTYPFSIMEPNGRSHVDRTKPSGWISDAESQPIHITNPARDLDIARCRACNGEWGHHGMMWTIDPSPGADPGDSCRCRTNDKDKHCEDGDDCQGWCELETFVVTGKLRYPVGRCSEFTEMQSCVTAIPSGARKQRPAPVQLTEMCID